MRHVLDELRLLLHWILILLLTQTPAFAGDEEEFEISDGEDAQVADLPQGEFLVVWEAEDEADGGIFAQLYEADGGSAGLPFQINQNGIDEQDQPAATGLATGEFVVVWRDDLGTEIVLLARRIAADGTLLGAEIPVNQAPAFAEDPAIAADAQGRFVVVWGGNDDLFVRRFAANGTPLGNELSFATAGPASQPTIAVAETGEFLVAWEDGDDIRAQLFDAAGLPNGGELLINTTLDGEQSDPTATAYPGGFLVAWQSEGQDEGGSAILARWIEGTPLGTEILVNTTTLGDQILPAAAVSASGNVLVTWQSEGGQDGSGSGIYGRLLSPPRSPICPDFLINTQTDGSQRNAAVTGRSRDYVVVWQTEPLLPPPGGATPSLQGRLLASPVFTDGFESGDAEAWSAFVTP